MKRNLASLMVDKETAIVVKTYCVLHQVKMQDFVHSAIRERLKGFEEILDKMKEVKR